MPSDEMVEKVARAIWLAEREGDTDAEAIWDRAIERALDDHEGELPGWIVKRKLMAIAALAAAEAGEQPVASNTRPAFGQGSYIADALTKNIPPCACQLGSASPPIRDEPVEDERRHCNHCAARFLTVWERCQHEREAHTRPPSEAAIRADERAAIRKEAFEEAARIAEATKNYDDNLQRSAGALPCGERIATAIRARGET